MNDLNLNAFTVTPVSTPKKLVPNTLYSPQTGELLNQIFKVGNAGGIRAAGSAQNGYQIILLTSNPSAANSEWQNQLSENHLNYYGDGTFENKGLQAKGNKIITSLESSKNSPPILFFEKYNNTTSYVFRGVFQPSENNFCSKIGTPAYNYLFQFDKISDEFVLEGFTRHEQTNPSLLPICVQTLPKPFILLAGISAQGNRVLCVSKPVLVLMIQIVTASRKTMNWFRCAPIGMNRVIYWVMSRV